jgi:hypothetical protein
MKAGGWRACTRSPAKAAVDKLVDLARAGYERKIGEDVFRVSAARARVPLTLAHQRFLAELQRDPDAELTEEAEAGAILEAEMATEIHRIHVIVEAWAEANRS